MSVQRLEYAPVTVVKPDANLVTNVRLLHQYAALLTILGEERLSLECLLYAGILIAQQPTYNCTIRRYITIQDALPALKITKGGHSFLGKLYGCPGLAFCLGDRPNSLIRVLTGKKKCDLKTKWVFIPFSCIKHLGYPSIDQPCLDDLMGFKNCKVCPKDTRCTCRCTNTNCTYTHFKLRVFRTLVNTMNIVPLNPDSMKPC